MVTFETIRQLRILCCGCQCNELNWSVGYRARLILFGCYSPTRSASMARKTTSESTVLDPPELLATQAKFLQPFCYCTVTYWTFTFCTRNCFGCSCVVVSQFIHVKLKFPNQTFLSTSLRLLNHNRSEAMNNVTCQRTNYHDTTNNCDYLYRQLELLYTRNILAAN